MSNHSAEHNFKIIYNLSKTPMGDFGLCTTIIKHQMREYILEEWWSMPPVEHQRLKLWWPNPILRHVMLVSPFICHPSEYSIYSLCFFSIMQTEFCCKSTLKVNWVIIQLKSVVLIQFGSRNKVHKLRNEFNSAISSSVENTDVIILFSPGLIQ